LFHLLISEAAANWSRVELRPALGRIFEHGKMKNASTNRVSLLNAFLRLRTIPLPSWLPA